MGTKRVRLTDFALLAALALLFVGCGSDTSGGPKTLNIENHQADASQSGETDTDTIADTLDATTENDDGDSEERDTSSSRGDTKEDDEEDDNSRCPANAEYIDGDCYCEDGYVPNDEQTACVRECTGDSDCDGQLICSDYSCVEPPCEPGSCGSGRTCSDSGDCIVEVGQVPSGPKPTCNELPNWECSGGESNCGELAHFDPRKGRGYWDYPINGETANNQYRSYGRKDLIKLVKHAAAAAKCLSQNWSIGNGKPLGLGDISEEDGAIPGTSDGDPGHPDGTHEDGYDIDIAYFQVGTSDNKLRPVCDHTSNGSREYHCVDEPDSLNVWRTALFIGKLHVSPQLRVIGVDGKIGPLIESAVTKLCDEDWLTGPACSELELAYEQTDEGRGWYRFHHHHMHVSLTSRSRAGLPTSYLHYSRQVETLKCLVPGCQHLP
jgi:hypothetical protein